MRIHCSHWSAVLVMLGCCCPSLWATGCGADSLSDDNDGAGDGAAAVWEGELVVLIADGVAEGGGLTSQTHYLLRTAAGGEHPLLFEHGAPDVPDLRAGDVISVRGTMMGAAVRVSAIDRRVALSSPAEARALTLRRLALTGGPAYPPRSFAFVMVDVGGGINVSAEAALANLLSDPDSLRNYYLAASYGRQDITAQVVGPISYSLPTCTTADTQALARTLRSQVPGTFQHYLWYLGSRTPACGWTGLASVGTPDTPTRDTWYNASTNCTVLVQEPGHNFGMQHSSSLACPGASFADDPNTCIADEYGDIFDPMGTGCRHMNAWQKAYQGWLGGCNGVSVTASGTFTVLPLENRCDGAQFLKVKATKPRTFDRAAAGGGAASVETMGFYYVELRTPVDFDGTVGNRSGLMPQILIHAGDDVRGRTQRGVHTYLLDMAPQTVGRAGFVDAALKVGTTFTDPAGGVSITAVAVSAVDATIRVDIEGGTGAPTCLDGTDFAEPGPGTESCGGGQGGGGGGAGAGDDNPSGGGASGSVAPAVGGSSGPDSAGCGCLIGGGTRQDETPMGPMGWQGGRPIPSMVGVGVMVGLSRVRRRRVRACARTPRVRAASSSAQ